MYLVAHTASDPDRLANPIVAQIHAIDPDTVVYDIRNMQNRLCASLARRRFASTLLGSFAIFAMILAAVGVYGVVSYIVSQNVHEIGIRVALGARSENIVGMVMQQGLSLAGVGIVVGLVGAAALTRLMSSLLFGVSPADWITFLTVAFVLAIVAVGASLIPAVRAINVDPTVALRTD